MKRLSNFFRSRNVDVTSPVNSRLIGEVMEQVDEAVKKIFDSNIIELLKEPLTNIVPAVWGAPADESRLTSTQRQIRDMIHPIVLKAHHALQTGELTELKDLAIDYLLKKLVILELAFMIGSYKLTLMTLAQPELTDAHKLADTEVAGHA